MRDFRSNLLTLIAKSYKAKIWYIIRLKNEQNKRKAAFRNIIFNNVTVRWIGIDHSAAEYKRNDPTVVGFRVCNSETGMEYL